MSAPRNARATSVFVIVALVWAAQAASGTHGTREDSGNLLAMGHSEHAAQFFGVPASERTISSDVAFWGHHAVHGNYDGFRIVDVSNPMKPKLVSHVQCNGDQGDVVV